MTVKGGKHCLTGIVSLGEFNNAVQGIKSGKYTSLYKNVRRSVF